MKRKHFLILLIIAVILALGGTAYQLSQSAGWSTAKTDREMFPNLAINDVAKIQIRAGSDNLTLQRENGDWRVAERGGYPADFAKIRDLIRSLWELKAVREMQVGPTQFGRLQISPPGATEKAGIQIDLADSNGKPISTLILGKKLEQNEESTAPGPAGRFVFNPSHPDRVDIVSESFFSVDPLVIGQWLDKAFVSADSLKEITQTGADPKTGWKLARANDKTEWKLEDAGANESVKKEFANSLTGFHPSIMDVRPANTALEQTGLQQPIAVDLTTFDGFEYRLAIGKEGPEKSRYLRVKVAGHFNEVRSPEPNEKPEDKQKRDDEFKKHLDDLKQRLEKEQKFEHWIYLVPEWSVEPLLKPRNEVLATAAPVPGPGASPVEPASPSPAPNASPKP
jgi:uncharacterized protein DUF4340